MILINKKRIKIIVSCILLSLLAFSFKIGKVNENINNIENIIETTSTPVSGKTVVLDAGHGIPDEGAQSSSRNNRSRNKLKDNFKGSKFARTKWM